MSNLWGYLKCMFGFHQWDIPNRPDYCLRCRAYIDEPEGW
jgi:hypothetical protein